MSRKSYQKVFDDRKRRIRGLWKHNDHFYAWLVIVDEAAGHKAVTATVPSSPLACRRVFAMIFKIQRPRSRCL